MTEPLTVVSPFAGWGASFRVRVANWAPHADFTIKPLPPCPRRPPSSNTWKRVRHELLLRANLGSDMTRLLIQREASSIGWGRAEKVFGQRADFTVVDLDDAVYLPVSSKVPSWLGSRPKRVSEALRRADRIVVGNEWLAEGVAHYGSDVVVIPSCIEPDAYVLPHRKAGPIVVGWLGSASTERHLDPLYPILADLQREFDIRVRIVGAGGPDRVERRGCRIELRPWSLSSQADELSRFDIAIAPHDDTPWARGKCGYKLLQYGAAGIASVADPVGVQSTIARGMGADTPSSPQDWAEILRELVRRSDLRRELGLRSRKFVTEHYSYRRWAPDWITAMEPGSSLRDV